MTKKYRKYRKYKKNTKRSRKYKGGAQYYTEEGDPDRDSMDVKMQSALGRLGITNAHEGEQSGWLAVSIGGIAAIGGIIAFLIIKR